MRIRIANEQKNNHPYPWTCYRWYDGVKRWLPAVWPARDPEDRLYWTTAENVMAQLRDMLK